MATYAHQQILIGRHYEASGRPEKALEHYRIANVVMMQMMRAQCEHSFLGCSTGFSLSALQERIHRIESELRQREAAKADVVTIPLTELLERTKAKEQPVATAPQTVAREAPAQLQKPQAQAQAQPPPAAAGTRERARSGAAEVAVPAAQLYEEGPKGFLNPLGENNCFLNVVLQSLWHMPSFATRFVATTEHTHAATGVCVFCVLQGIFAQYQYSGERHLPAREMRMALCELYKPESRFQMGALEDAAEALDVVLSALHEAIADRARLAGAVACDGPPCLVHDSLGITVAEQAVCDKCGAEGDASIYQSFLFYTNAASLREYHGGGGLPLDETMRRVMLEDQRSCPEADSSHCAGRASLRRSLLYCPEIFTIGLAWDSGRPSPNQIKDTLKAISVEIDLSKIFDGCPPTVYTLRGMICFVGMHYKVFLYDQQRKVWSIFNDTVVKDMERVETVAVKCVEEHLHPTVLFYERTDATRASAASVLQSQFMQPSPSFFSLF